MGIGHPSGMCPTCSRYAGLYDGLIPANTLWKVEDLVVNVHWSEMKVRQGLRISDNLDKNVPRTTRIN